MRKLIFILLLFPVIATAQNNVYTFNAADGTPMKRYDTTITGWNARGPAGSLGYGTVRFYSNIIDSVNDGGNVESAMYINKSSWTGNTDSLKMFVYDNIISLVANTSNQSFIYVVNSASLMGKGAIRGNTFVSSTKTLIGQMVTTNAGDTAKFMAEFPTEFSRKGTEANSFGGTYNTAMITIEDADEVVIGDDNGVIVKDTIPKRDTIRIHDTLQVPVYLVDVTDTIPATVLYKKSEKSDRIYTVKGFALVRGFKVFVNGKAQWADKPQIVGAIDDKKRLIKNVIQVL